MCVRSSCSGAVEMIINDGNKVRFMKTRKTAAKIQSLNSRQFVDILCKWYTANSNTVLNGMVNSQISLQHAVGSGKGSCLSPAVFNVLMNVFIKVLKCQRVGCCI